MPRKEGDPVLNAYPMRLPCNPGNYGSNWAGLELPECESGSILSAYNIDKDEARLYICCCDGWHYTELKE